MSATMEKCRTGKWFLSNHLWLRHWLGVWLYRSLYHSAPPNLKKNCCWMQLGWITTAILCTSVHSYMKTVITYMAKWSILSFKDRAVD